MPRGHPDWNLSPGHVGVSQLGDLAELAARLGSIVTYERSGSVVFAESFERGYSGWYFDPIGENAKYRLTADRIRSGGYALALYPGQDSDRTCLARRSFPLPIYGRLGLEVSCTPDEKIIAVWLGMTTFDGVSFVDWYVAYNWDDNLLYYLPEGGEIVEFVADVDLSRQEGLFHTFKLVVDLATEKYVRLFVNETEYDMSTYLPHKDSSGDAPRVDVYVVAEQAAADTPALVVDDVILTQNEP